MTTAAAEVLVAMGNIRALRKEIEVALKGRLVRVISDHNGQPYGRSKPSWRGQERRITDVHVDAYYVELSLDGHEYECFIPADEVELV
jgi:hypothetical protein